MKKGRKVVNAYEPRIPQIESQRTNLKNNTTDAARWGSLKRCLSHRDQIAAHLFVQNPSHLTPSQNSIYCSVYLVRPWFLGNQAARIRFSSVLLFKFHSQALLIPHYLEWERLFSDDFDLITPGGEKASDSIFYS